MLPTYNFGGMNESLNAPLMQQQESNPYQSYQNQSIPVAQPVATASLPVQEQPIPVEMAQPVQIAASPLDYLTQCIFLLLNLVIM